MAEVRRDGDLSVKRGWGKQKFAHRNLPGPSKELQNILAYKQI